MQACYNYFNQPPPPKFTEAKKASPTTTAKPAKFIGSTSKATCGVCGRERNLMEMLSFHDGFYCDGPCGKKAFVEYYKNKRNT